MVGISEVGLDRIYKNLYIGLCGTSLSDGWGARAATSERFQTMHAGFQLRRVQQGLEPNDWKAMATVGPGVREIRIHTDLEHRVLYVATFAEAVYVRHAFEKRTRKTPPRELQLARERFRALVMTRRGTGDANQQ